MPALVASKRQLAVAFDRWLAEYQKNPAAWAEELAKAGAGYGEACADHLIKLVTDEANPGSRGQ